MIDENATISKPASCCAPRDVAKSVNVIRPRPKPTARMDPSLRDCVPVPGGMALVGTNSPDLEVDGEASLRRKKVKRLFWERGAVTNAAFSRFVAATGYATEAEVFGWSFVFYGHLADAAQDTLGVDGLEW
jgi:formylglycine-generating enzyme required for sulfatase activity